MRAITVEHARQKQLSARFKALGWTQSQDRLAVLYRERIEAGEKGNPENPIQQWSGPHWTASCLVDHEELIRLRRPFSV